MSRNPDQYPQFQFKTVSYGRQAVVEFDPFGGVEETFFYVDTVNSCCGVGEFGDFQHLGMSTYELQRLACFLAGGDAICGNYAAITCYIVEDWDSAPAIIDALVLGGWRETFPPTRNPNSGNMISGWIYTKGE